MDLFRAARMRANIMAAVIITGGDRAHYSGESVVRSQAGIAGRGMEALLEVWGADGIAGRLREAARLVKEFESMQVEGSPSNIALNAAGRDCFTTWQ